MFKPFKAPVWARNPHLQTILPTFIKQGSKTPFFTQTLKTPDGDFLDICWTERPEQIGHKPLIAIFHGLEGSIHSPYAHGMLNAVKKRGWAAVLMHFRGCSGRPNLKLRAYHSGEMDDPLFFLQQVRQQCPKAQLACIGYSLGGNMLLNLLAVHRPTYIRAAVAVSAPVKLELCAARLQQGFSRVYQRHLLNRMKRNFRIKQSQLDCSPEQKQVTHKIHNLVDFDEYITAPLQALTVLPITTKAAALFPA